MSKIYLDYAAATPLSPDVLAVMRPYFSEKFYNPSAIYLDAKAIRKDIDEARSNIASCLGTRPAEVIYTSGATESNNMVLQGIRKRFPAGEIIVSAIEHESIAEPAQMLGAKIAPVDEHGLIKLAELEKLISDHTVLVSVIWINNEIGTVQPIHEISKLLNKLSNLRRENGNKLPLYLHTDATQAPLYFDLHVSRLGVDMMTINGGKIYGPKQSGVLYLKAGTQIDPMIVGGGQEFGMRSGTENVPSIIGLSKSLVLAQQERHEESRRLHELREAFVKDIENTLPGAIVNGSKKYCAPHIVSVSFPGQDNERLMMMLDEAGIMCATGSACSASSDKPSAVLEAIGISEADARATLRFSFGKNTNLDDLKRSVEKLAQTIVNNR